MYEPSPARASALRVYFFYIPDLTIATLGVQCRKAYRAPNESPQCYIYAAGDQPVVCNVIFAHCPGQRLGRHAIIYGIGCTVLYALQLHASRWTVVYIIHAEQSAVHYVNSNG